MRTIEKKVNKYRLGRRDFLRLFGKAVAYAGVLLGAGGFLLSKLGTAAAKVSFPRADYDWTKHRWGFGVDVNRCIGCLRCVEACKIENGVSRDAHHFRTWVERYVRLKGEKHARIDSQADPQNIAASGSEKEFRFDNRYKQAKVEDAFFVPKLCNQCERPPCVQVCPVGATYRTKDGVVLIDHNYCIGCQYCVQACPYGARIFNFEHGVTDKCTWCYHRITKGLNPACVDVCPVNARIFGDLNEPESPISKFLRDNRVQVLKPEMGTRPTVYYVGIDKEVM